ncbi:hypothetical protein PMIN03_013009 [Paraphaeosphaeria minitans]
MTRTVFSTSKTKMASTGFAEGRRTGRLARASSPRFAGLCSAGPFHVPGPIEAKSTSSKPYYSRRQPLSLNAMEQCVPLFHRWSMLRQVAIKCSSMTFETDYGKAMLISILNYCKENVDVSVRVHIPYWSQADPNFVPRGLSYLFALRKQSALIKRLAQATSVSYLLDAESEQVRMNVQVPLNLRWVPREERFNPSLFERNIRRHPLLSSSSAQAAIEGLKELAEGWFMHGL